MQAFPLERSVLLTDNCITHHYEGWILSLQAKGVEVIFLEKLSPTLNPIEDAFKLTRMWSRYYCDQLHLFSDTETFIRCALMSVGYEAARHCVHNCSTFGGTPAYANMLARFDVGVRAGDS
jgi:hypothetical protein